MFRKIKKFIDENIAIIMIANLIFAFIVAMIGILLALFGIISEHEFKMLSLVAAAPICFTFLFDTILMLFFG